MLGTNVGSFEDWAYTAGWYTEEDRVSDTCNPTSAPDLNITEFFNATAAKQVKTAIFRIFTGDLDPPTTLYGG